MWLSCHTKGAGILLVLAGVALYKAREVLLNDEAALEVSIYKMRNSSSRNIRDRLARNTHGIDHEQRRAQQPQHA